MKPWQEFESDPNFYPNFLQFFRPQFFRDPNFSTPVVKTEYILKERSLVCFVLAIFIACGRNAEVVHVPATYPIIVMISISSSSRS